MFGQILFLLFGVFCCSSAVIFVKESAEHPILLASYRTLVAAIALTPLFLRDAKKHREHPLSAHVRTALLPGVVLGLHFISWIIGARMTTAANATLIVNLNPIVMPFLMAAMIQETLTRPEFTGTLSALAGIVLLAWTDFNLSRTYFWGDVLCFLSMILFSYYLALGRKNRHIQSLWLYVTPLYYLTALFCFLCALPLVNPIKPYPLKEIVLILGLGIVPTILGHSILNYSMQQLRGQVVSVINMAQFIFAGILAFFRFGEIPDRVFYLASVLIIVGAGLATSPARQSGR